MDPKTQFEHAVLSMAELPALLRENVARATVASSRFDETYIEFLDRMIQTGARGPHRTALYIRRRAALLPYCGVELLHGQVKAGDVLFSVSADPKTGMVIHWEQC